MSQESEPRLYTGEEWAAMSEHDRDVVREDRRRAVEHEREQHRARLQLLEDLTAERFGNPIRQGENR